jgi:hypothetical protein
MLVWRALFDSGGARGPPAPRRARPQDGLVTPAQGGAGRDRQRERPLLLATRPRRVRAGAPRKVMFALHARLRQTSIANSVNTVASRTEAGPS